MRPRPSPIRETAAAAPAGCARCGGGWDHAVPTEAIVAAIAADAALLATMEAHECPVCSGPRGWDVVTGASGSRGGAAEGSAWRGVLLAIRVQLALGRRPDLIASWIRREIGVVGILVEDRSEVGRRLGLDWTSRAPGPASGR